MCESRLNTPGRSEVRAVGLFPNAGTLDIFIVGNTFEDSTLQKVVNTSDFVLDPVSGKYLLPYRIIRSPGAQGGGSPCHTIKIEQGSDQVGQ